MLDDKAKLRLIRNLVTAIQTNDQTKLTRPSILWLSQNYWLRHHNWPIDTGGSRKITQEKINEFNTAFNLFEWIECEVDMNHALSWLVHWYVKGQYQSPEQENEQLCRFRQRIEVDHAVRKAIGLKNYVIHYVAIDWRGKRKRHKTVIRGRSMQEAVSQWRKRWSNRSHFNSVNYWMKRIKEHYESPIYMLSNTLPPHILKALT
jgi:hypothetical protein